MKRCTQSHGTWALFDMWALTNLMLEAQGCKHQLQVTMGREGTEEASRGRVSAICTHRGTLTPFCTRKTLPNGMKPPVFGF